MLSDVQQKLESADEAALKEMKAKDLGSVHAEEKRWDLKLPLLPEVRSAVELLVRWQKRIQTLKRLISMIEIRWNE